MIRPSVLLFALLMTAPAVYRYVVDEVDLTVVLVRFLIAVPLAALMLAGVRFVAATYARDKRSATPAAPEATSEQDKHDRS